MGSLESLILKLVLFWVTVYVPRTCPSKFAILLVTITDIKQNNYYNNGYKVLLNIFTITMKL
ncbi:hypothetical protein [Clostridium estertheticum]|uniref:hypothetical protein n=1 Tax=Clostridium estertheticum TaxID=238834 RepID=UPI001C0E2094|nr:hypothetical protein [Clostridium estertheticum]MBU3187650.1 hypothetical protein [Clostridium estertheticum]